MSVRPDSGSLAGVLHGTEGELVSLTISVEPRLLERLLDALARLEFPINPQIYHIAPAAIVEFPAWAGRVPEVLESLARNGLSQAVLTARSMLERIRTAGAA